MELKTIKRNGTVVDFDSNKIHEAVKQATLASHEEMDDYTFDDTICSNITSRVVNLCNKHCQDTETDTIDIETIQDFVERILIKLGYADVAKEYITYRQKRTDIRNTRDSIEKSISEILNLDSKDSDLKRDNGNVDGDGPMGSMLQIGSNVSKNYYLNNSISKDIVQAYNEGCLYIHDLDFYALTMTCCQIDCLKLFKGGFNTGHGFLREPNSIGSYATLAAIAIQSDQNDQHGGQSIPNFDYSMAPGIYKTFRKSLKDSLYKFSEFFEHESTANKSVFEEVSEHISSLLNNTYDELDEYLVAKADVYKISSDYLVDKYVSKIIKLAFEDTKKQTYQAMEGFIHNLNTLHSRAGAQVPFSSINLGTDTTNAGRMVIENLLLALEAGLGHGETSIFPIVIFKVKEGVNYFEEDPNYDLFKLSMRVSAKRLFPNYVFLDAPFNLQYYKPGHPETEVSTMGKLRLTQCNRNIA